MTTVEHPPLDLELSTPSHRLVFAPCGSELEAARECEAAVFLDRYGNTREQLADEYGPYEDQTVFLALLAPDGRAEAAIRFIVPGPAGLKSLVDAQLEPWGLEARACLDAVGLEPSRTWDIATLSVRKDRTPGVAHIAAMYHGIAACTRVNGITGTVALLDTRVLRMLHAVSLQYRPLPGARPAPYLGSDSSVPVYAHMATMLDTQRRLAPEAWRLFVAGVGIEGVSLPSHASLALPVVQQGVLDLRESYAAASS
jgi:hypothetical protein